MNRGTTIAAAFALDMLVGDPAWLPHPVRIFGEAIVLGEPAMRRMAGEGQQNLRFAGSLLASGIVAGAAITAMAVEGLIDRFGGHFAAESLRTILAATTLATRDLLVEADTILDALEVGDLGRARIRLARIVGRDTADLDRYAIVRATIETLAESACDGIVAPLIALAVGGAPAAFAFKAASSLDSMIGHIEPPYTDFGRFAAKLDDGLCFVPARICAWLICLAAPIAAGSQARAWRTLKADGGKHASPNAGRPEAAMAGALGVRLGGVNRYDGIERHGALLGEKFPEPDLRDARRAWKLVVAVSCIAAAGCALVTARVGDTA